MIILCFLRSIWRSIISLCIVSGHNYCEMYSNKDIQILMCEDCHHISVGWNGSDDNEYR